MKYFLHTVAEELGVRFKGKMQSLAIVFPNRRQGVYFLDYLKETLQPPAILPELLTIEELVQRSSVYPVAEPMVQVFALYEAFVQVSLSGGDDPSTIPSFESFFSLGETLVRDFRELDTNLADVKQVYKVMENIEAIDKLFDYLTEEQRSFLKRFWEGAAGKSSAQEKFLKLWQRLPEIYDVFFARLAEGKLTTAGAAYRSLAGGNHTRKGFELVWDHIAFVGLNALSKAEEGIIRSWQDAGRASLWLDADAWYSQLPKAGEPTKEAGLFIRRNLYQAKLKNEQPLLQVIENKTMDITALAAPGQIAQAKLVGRWIETLPPVSERTRAAIILADEELLLPLLQSLPEVLTDFNVTMGFPIKHSPVYSFVKLFFSVHSHLGKTKYKSLYHEIVTAWLNHPFCDFAPEKIDSLKGEMVKDGWVQVAVKRLLKLSAMGNLLFSPVMGMNDAFSRLALLLEAANKLPAVEKDGLLQGLVGGAWQAINQLAPLYAGLRPMPDLEFVGKMLQRQVGALRVPFEGEPLKGIQIMGLLESRGLDFEHILLMGAGEGSLPRARVSESYLPDNVRRAFGLPVSEHQDAIFAYGFYRLLHCCQSLTVVFNAQVTESSTGELSRFFKQVDYETSMKVNVQYPGFEVRPSVQPPIVVEKAPEVMQYLYHYFKPADPKSLSPSAINTWLTCRLQFYFRYIANLKEQNKLEEGIDAAGFGSVVHKLMELLYRAVMDHQGHGNITGDSIAYMRSVLTDHLEPAFRLGWRDNKSNQPFQFNGELAVVKEVVRQYAESYLKIDETIVPFTVHEMELNLKKPFAIEINGRPERVDLGGIIDRVDEQDGIFRMVDYKTGADKLDFSTIARLFERDGGYSNKAALQTLMYCWMFGQQYPQRTQFAPALIPLRALKGAPGDVFFREKDGRGILTPDVLPDVLLEYRSLLKMLVEEIFDASIPFDQTTETGTCRYCDYKEICGR